MPTCQYAARNSSLKAEVYEPGRYICKIMPCMCNGKILPKYEKHYIYIYIYIYIEIFQANICKLIHNIYSYFQNLINMKAENSVK